MKIQKIAQYLETFPRLHRLGIKIYGFKGFNPKKTNSRLFNECEFIQKQTLDFSQNFDSIYMFDLQCLQTKTRERGIGKYTIEFLEAMTLQNPKVCILGFFTNLASPGEVMAGVSLLSEIKCQNFKVIQILITSKNRKIKSIKAMEILQKEIEKYNAKYVFNMSPFEKIQNAIPILGSTKYRKISIFYDGIPLKYSKDLLPSRKLKQLYKWQLSELIKSDLVFSISNYSTEDLLKLGISRDKVQTIWGGPKNLKQVNLRKTSRERYGIVCITAEQKHKNLSKAIEAYAQIPEDIRNIHPLLIVGIRSQKYRKYLSKKIYNIRSNVFILPYLSENEMYQILETSKILLMPSLAEGLSLPALDAVNFDLLVVSSKGTVVDEIIKTPISTFDAQNPNEISGIMMKFLKDDSLWNSILAKQKENVRFYSWSNTAIIASERLRNAF